jgi:hypothetical protein
MSVPKHLCPKCRTPKILAPKQPDGWICKCRAAQQLLDMMDKLRG